MDKTKKILILSIMPIFLTLIFILYIVAPKVQKLNELNKQFEQETSAYTEAQSQLDTLNNDRKLLNKIQNLKEELGDFDINVPEEDDLSILLIDLGNFAESVNVKVLSLDSKPEVEKEIIDTKKKKTSSTHQIRKKITASPLYAIPVEISAVGRYNDILNFINKLEKYGRTIAVNNLKVENYKEDKDTASPRVQMTIDCEIYRFNSQITEQKDTSNKAETGNIKPEEKE